MTRTYRFVGQKISSHKYNAFVGCNNSAMGRKAADKIAELLPDGGNIIIINGFKDYEKVPPYYRDRSYAFIHEFDGYPDIRMAAEFNANWDKEQAHFGMDSLKTVLGETKVDLVFSYGYEMLQGARESMKWPEAIYIGMEGVPGEGIYDIISGQTDATFVSPTGVREPSIPQFQSSTVPRTSRTNSSTPSTWTQAMLLPMTCLQRTLSRQASR